MLSVKAVHLNVFATVSLQPLEPKADPALSSSPSSSKLLSLDSCPVSPAAPCSAASSSTARAQPGQGASSNQLLTELIVAEVRTGPTGDHSLQLWLHLAWDGLRPSRNHWRRRRMMPTCCWPVFRAAVRRSPWSNKKQLLSLVRDRMCLWSITESACARRSARLPCALESKL